MSVIFWVAVGAIGTTFALGFVCIAASCAPWAASEPGASLDSAAYKSGSRMSRHNTWYGAMMPRLMAFDSVIV